MHHFNLIFLPGWGFKASVFSKLILNLNLKNKIKFVNLPTHLFNQFNFTHSFTHSHYHSDKKKLFFDLISHLQAEIFSDSDSNSSSGSQSILIGWSLGGLLAIALAYRFPEKYQKLILISSLPKFVAGKNWHGISQKNARYFHTQAQANFTDLFERFLNLVSYSDSQANIHIYLKKHCHAYDTNKFNKLDDLKIYLDILFNTDMRKPYQKLSLPITHISGDKDAVVPIKAIQQLAHLKIIKTIKKNNVTLNILPSAGHAPFLTHPELFIRYFKQALLDGIHV